MELNADLRWPQASGEHLRKIDILVGHSLRLYSHGTLPNSYSLSRRPRDLEASDFLLQFSFISQYIHIAGCFYLASFCN